jgi:AraC-like DNA-binding protein
MSFGPLCLIDISGSAYRSTREGPGQDGWASILFQLDGTATLADRHRSARLSPGDVCVVPPDGDIVAERDSSFRQILVNVKTDDLDAVLPQWRECVARTIESARPRVRPVSDLLRFVLEHRGDLDTSCRERLAATTLTLLGGLLDVADAASPGVASGKCSRLATFHRQRIERYIVDNLRDPELNVAKIARELGLSTRYVHKLFEAEPANVMQRAMAQRLRECHRDVASRGARSISDVAYSWGFNSPAHFSRAFKKHFGVRPSDV